MTNRNTSTSIVDNIDNSAQGHMDDTDTDCDPYSAESVLFISSPKRSDFCDSSDRCLTRQRQRLALRPRARASISRSDLLTRQDRCSQRNGPFTAEVCRVYAASDSKVGTYEFSMAIVC